MLVVSVRMGGILAGIEGLVLAVGGLTRDAWSRKWENAWRKSSRLLKVLNVQGKEWELGRVGFIDLISFFSTHQNSINCYLNQF